jgi:hypothetical protein
MPNHQFSPNGIKKLPDGMTVVLSLSEPKSVPVPELLASNVLSLKNPYMPTWYARESNLVIEAGLLPAAISLARGPQARTR